jgi:hypothetical protein
METSARYFNTSGPNIRAQHYTLERPALVAKGLRMVENMRYFTIWAPRQSGKSTYFRLLAEVLETRGYKVVHINFEDYRTNSLARFLQTLKEEVYKFLGIEFQDESDITGVLRKIQNDARHKYVFVVDEVEGINPEYFGSFLHSIRSAYHTREMHSLKSVIFVGVSNITGIVQDHASPFNISDSLPIDYFSREELYELYGQHEAESGQRFSEEVKDRIYAITAGQPGLVNGFGLRLMEQNPGKPLIGYSDYLDAEEWYLYKALDKNVSNVINKAKAHQKFLEELLFLERKMRFDIDKEHIRYFHVNGLIKDDPDGNILFWVPLYKKRLQKYFYPDMNGESERIQENLWAEKYLDAAGQLDMDKVIREYQAYAKKRGFRYFIVNDEQGRPKGLREAALMYSFETYIQSFLQVFKGKSYLEPHVGLGRSDLAINLLGSELVVEAKVFSHVTQFAEGKTQLAYYATSLGLSRGIYLVFVRSTVQNPKVLESVETINGVEVATYLVPYDLETDFSAPKAEAAGPT